MTFAEQLRQHATDARNYARSKGLEVSRLQKALASELAEIERLMLLAQDYDRAADREAGR